MSRLSRRHFVRSSMIGLGFAAAGWPAALVRATEAVNKQDREAFLAAVAAGDATAVRRFLAADAGLIAARDAAGRSPYLIAGLGRHEEVARIIREHGYALDLHEAAFAGEWEYFDAMARETLGAVDAFHPVGGTAMYAAALGGAGSDIWHVYQHAADPNRRGDPARAMTPVRAAFEHPDLAVAEMTAASLLGNAARADATEPDGGTALHAAATRGSVDIAEMLVRKGAPVAARDARGRTALDLAEEKKHAAVAALLRHHERIPLDHSTSRTAYDLEGKPYDPPDIDDLPVLERGRVVGVAHGDLDAVRERVEAEPRLAHSQATTDERAVEACGHTGRKEIVDYLLDKGAPYALPTAVMRGDLATARRLLAEDPLRIHERGPHDFALLWYPVIGGGDLALAELLLDAGAEVERQHHMGTTALHWAAARGQLEMAELLIARGADVDRPGRKFPGGAQTPLDRARARDQGEMVALLKRHGAKG